MGTGRLQAYALVHGRLLNDVVHRCLHLDEDVNPVKAATPS